MSAHAFCRGLLRGARVEAKDKGKKIPPISSSKMSDDHYAVFLGDDWYDEYSACCAYHARSEAIFDFLDGYVSPLNRGAGS